MQATATKASSPAAAVQSDAAAESKAVNVVTGSPQQIPLWADRAMPVALPMAPLAAASSVQFSLRVNAPDDKYEREADQVAEQLMRRPSPVVQRKTCACGRPAGPGGMCHECRQKHLLQRKANRDRPGNAPGNETGAPPQVQTGLKIGSVGDRYEQEADRVAAQVMRMSQPFVQRRCARCEEEEQAATPALALNAMPLAKAAAQPETATRSTAAPEEAATEKGVPAPIQLTPTSLLSGGYPLPPALQAYYEDRFQYDFSRVRVHTGKSAAEKADALQAHAFTFSNHIYLGSGKSLVPSTLLAHELTHVIQQTLPQPKRPGAAYAFGSASAPAATIQQATGREPLVQGDFYWVPLVAKTKGSGLKGSGGMTGNQIEKELEPHLAGWTMSTQVNIPNGNRDGTGLGFVGRADLYQGTPIGIRYVDPAKGTCNGQPLGTVTDKKGAGPARMNGSTGRPNLAGGKIADVASAPDAITLGEIKPASKKWILFGQQQVANYKQGIAFAREQTNCTLTQTSSSEPQWPPITVDNIQQGTNPLPSALQFTPGVTTPGSTYSLGIGTFLGTAGVGMKGKGSVGDDIGTKITFNPLTDLNPPTPITGEMYAQIDNLGVLAYFFRPNLSRAAINALITSQHKSFRKGLEAQATTAFATQVQDDIITTLTAPPHIVTFSWHHRPLVAGQQPQPVPVSQLPQAGKPLPIQTKPKKSNPKKLEDRFKLAAWNSSLSKLSTRFKQEEKTDDFKQLKFIHLLYETEEQYRDDKLPNELGSLPSEDTLKAEIGTEKTDSSGKKTGKVTKTLPDVYPWLDFWTDARIKPLGLFRDKFGSSFVVVLNKFTELRDKIRDKFKSAFNSQSSGTSGKAKMIAKALGKALVQLAKILVPHTTELVMTAVKAGIEKKLNQLFDLDQLKAVARDKLEEEFGKFTAPLVEFKNGVEAHIKQTIETYTGDLSWIKQVMDLSKIVGPIAEAAAIAIQCGTPPGWGCLKILLRSLQNCAIEAALNICAVQKEIANLVAALGPVANLPATLAQTIMDVLRKAAPDGLKDIFDEPIPQQPFPSGDEIECEDTPPETKCPGLMPGAGMNSPGPGEEHKAMAKLQEEFGPDKLGGVQQMADAAGVPDDAPFTTEDATNVGDKLREAGDISAQDLADTASGGGSADVKARLKPLQEYLEKKAQKSVLDEVRKELKKGTYKVRFDEMAKRKMHWLLLKPYRPGPFKNMPALMWNEDIRAAGVVDGEYGPCYDDGKVPVTITRAEMFDEQDQPVTVVTPFHDADARLHGHTCDTPPKPPPPQPPAPKRPPPKGGKSAGGQSGQPGGAAGGQGKSESGKGKAEKPQAGAGAEQGGAGAEQGQGGAGGKGQEAGEGGLGVGVGSDVEPGSSGDRVEEAPPGTEAPPGQQGEQPGEREEQPGEQEEEQPGPTAEQEKPPESKQPEPNVPAAPKPKPEKPPEAPGGSPLAQYFGFCEFLLECPFNQWPVEFEEMPGFAAGWQVLPGSNLYDPKGTWAITNPPNPSAILSVEKTSGGAIEIYQTEDGKKTLVGRGKASSEAGMTEITSGILFEQFRSALKGFIAKKRQNPAHAQKRAIRFHFKGD